jgi:hypothetical protein
MTDNPSPPRGLKTAGRRLWREVRAAFELRADELRILEAACRLSDELAVLDKALRTAPALTQGSQGQDVMNPLFAAARQHRLALGRLLAQLGLDDADAEHAGQARSAAGRRLARQRWQRKAGGTYGT